MFRLKPLNTQSQPHVDDDGFGLIETCKLSFRTLNDLERLNAFMQRMFIDQKGAVTGIYALALNAIEHGNLGIGYEMKAELMMEQTWQQEVEKRLQEARYKDRQASLVLTHKDEGTYVIITDQGQGFQWQDYMSVDPSRSARAHGRGIAIANSLSFDKLGYNEMGNQVTAFIKNPHA